ncbi:hypothetical protein [Methylocella sp. CPCC 101449]|jgi:hypothetical protein|uniref:hypothetical protein n=1 Tax=Methylocella sp. CPCC 101449 TaxID=2987531 RepID=UPI000968AB16|nr:hypothetical protein [Methylocella sp. CPCC 101449]MBN9082795.1 hypothetical protein [Hyphomicrobiales bacterium]MDT2022506.1 hypothetical protein [Methylocella sp. CPCC 101449]OJY04079.1 MAG: hypothetical protein BGP04_01220 [Rhizobiales bacterium 62-17]HEV2572764.1 hypothetical protein [Beijerinckiaceae bacterium]
MTRSDDLNRIADRLWEAGGDDRKYAGVARDAAEKLARDRCDVWLAVKVDVLVRRLCAQGKMEEGQALAEAAFILRAEKMRGDHAQAA